VVTGQSFGGEREVKRMEDQFREMLKLGVIDLQQPSPSICWVFFCDRWEIENEGQRTVGKVRGCS